MNTERVGQFIALTREKRIFDAKLKAIKVRIAALEAEILDEQLEEGWESTKIDGITVSRRVDVRAGVKSEIGHEEAGIVLRSLGLDFLIGAPTIHHMRLGSWVREIQDAGEEIPERVLEVINVYNIPAMRCTGIGEVEG